jgi:hypothetical protein
VTWVKNSGADIRLRVLVLIQVLLGEALFRRFRIWVQLNVFNCIDTIQGVFYPL